MTRSRRAARSYRRAYPDPIAVSAGEAVRIGEEDTEYPGWVWCTDPRGKAGWLPLAILDRDASRVRRDYSALELSIDPGETLTIDHEESGWALCRNGRGDSGWVPLTHLEPEA